MRFVFDVPDESVPAIVQAVCGTYGYRPPAGKDGLPPDNDVLGCDSVTGAPTAAGLAFAQAHSVAHFREVVVGWQARQVDAQAAEAKAKIREAVAAVPVTVEQG